MRVLVFSCRSPLSIAPIPFADNIRTQHCSCSRMHPSQSPSPSRGTWFCLRLRLIRNSKTSKWVISDLMHIRYTPTSTPAPFVGSTRAVRSCHSSSRQPMPTTQRIMPSTHSTFPLWTSAGPDSHVPSSGWGRRMNPGEFPEFRANLFAFFACWYTHARGPFGGGRGNTSSLGAGPPLACGLGAGATMRDEMRPLALGAGCPLIPAPAADA